MATSPTATTPRTSRSLPQWSTPCECRGRCRGHWLYQPSSAPKNLQQLETLAKPRYRDTKWQPIPPPVYKAKVTPSTPLVIISSFQPLFGWE
jgi:hypothetical protein